MVLRNGFAALDLALLAWANGSLRRLLGVIDFVGLVESYIVDLVGSDMALDLDLLALMVGLNLLLAEVSKILSICFDLIVSLAGLGLSQLDIIQVI